MSASFVESLVVENLRQFDYLKVSFNEKFNLIAGPNGCGKTSLLACVAHCFSHENISYSRASSRSAMYVDVSHKGRKFRIGLGKGSYSDGGYRDAKIKQWVQIPADAGREVILNIKIDEKIPDLSPLVIGAKRALSYKHLLGMTAEQPMDKSRQQYRASGAKDLFEDSAGNVKQWLLNRYFVNGKDWAEVESANWDHLMAALPSIAPFGSDFRFVKIERDMEPIFSIYGKECYLEELSSGFQAVLTIIARIIEWCERVNEDKKWNYKQGDWYGSY